MCLCGMLTSTQNPKPGVRYHRAHYAGIAICLCGMLTLVVYDTDRADEKDSQVAEKKLIGDAMALCAAFLYGLSNILQEHLALRYGATPVLAALGAGGAVISAVQLSLLPDEIASIRALTWTSAEVLLLLGYQAALWLFYSLAPVIIMHAGSAFFNLSLLTSDFWAAAFGSLELKEPLTPPYLVSFALTVGGLAVYHMHGEPTRQPHGLHIRQPLETLETLETLEPIRQPLTAAFCQEWGPQSLSDVSDFGERMCLEDSVHGGNVGGSGVEAREGVGGRRVEEEAY